MVAALQKRANNLAAAMAKPVLLEAEFSAMRERLPMPPALPHEDFGLKERSSLPGTDFVLLMRGGCPAGDELPAAPIDIEEAR